MDAHGRHRIKRIVCEPTNEFAVRDESLCDGCPAKRARDFFFVLLNALARVARDATPMKACIDGWNPSLSYKDFAVRYKVFARTVKKTSEL